MAKFFGSSIISFDESAGWGASETACDINLIDCAIEGDMFSPPTIGTPSRFEYEGHYFFGILDRYTRNDSTSGYPQYTVHLTNGVFLLAGTKLILNDYYGASNGIPNLINVFGYLENTGGFGASEVNDAGISWSKINTTLNTLVNNSTGTSYGGCIRHKSFKYGIDLSLLPAIPNYYRINNNSMSLLEFIEEVCEAGGHDFLVSLEYLTPSEQVLTGLNAKFKIYTVSRLDEPTPGKIQAYVDSSNCVTQSEIGQELRKDANSKLVVGGPVDRMWYISPASSGSISGGITQAEYAGYSVLPYFGVDTDGNYITGYTYEDEPSEYYFDIDIRDVAHNLIGDTYTTSLGELRAAQKGRESWERFLASKACNKYIMLDNSLCGSGTVTARPFVIPMDTGFTPRYSFNPTGEYAPSGDYHFEAILKYTYRFTKAKYLKGTITGEYETGRPAVPMPTGLTPSTYYLDYASGVYPPDSYTNGTNCAVNIKLGQSPAAAGRLLPNLYYPSTSTLNPYFMRAFLLKTPAQWAIPFARLLEGDAYYVSQNCAAAHQDFYSQMYDAFKVSTVDQYTEGLVSKLASDVTQKTKYVEGYYQDKCNRIYKKIKDLADNYLGKRYIVLVPTTYGAVEPESTTLRFSQEPTDSAYIDSTEWDDAYTNRLIPDISGLNIITTPENKFYPYIKVTGVVTYSGVQPTVWPYNFSEISVNERTLGSPVVSGSFTTYDLWAKCSVMDKLVYYDNSTLLLPRAVVELPGKVTYDLYPNYGSVAALRTAIVNHAMGPGGAFASDASFTTTAVSKVLNRVAGDLPDFSEGSWHKVPDLFAVPLRSNLLCYGPWYSAGANGPVDYEKNDDLVPWNYGGYAPLDLAGNARVNDGITDQTFDETGSVTVAGAPTLSIGDQVITGGPYITDIRVSVSSNGVTTQYSFQTWSSQRRLSKLTNFNSERIKRLNQVTRSMGRAFREGVGNNLWKSPVEFFNDIRGKFVNLEDYPKRDKSTTSHTVIAGEINGCQSTVAIQPAYNSTTQLNDNYHNKVMVSLDSLFKPYSNQPHDTLPSLTVPTNTGDPFTSFDLYPLRDGHNFNVLTGSSGTNIPYDSAEGMGASVSFDANNIPAYRGMAWNGPIVISQWGRDVNGDPVPLMVDSGDQPILDSGGNKQWAYDYVYNHKNHKTGVLGISWEEETGMWGFNNIHIAVTATNFAAASGLLSPASGQVYDYIPSLPSTGNLHNRIKPAYVFESSVGPISSGTIVYYYSVGTINHIIFAGCDSDTNALTLLETRNGG